MGLRVGDAVGLGVGTLAAYVGPCVGDRSNLVSRYVLGLDVGAFVGAYVGLDVVGFAVGT